MPICPICQKDKPKLVNDHCHRTGMQRNQICAICNAGLGMFKDNINSLKRAVAYLRYHRKRSAPVGIDHAQSTLDWLKQQHAKRFRASQ